MSPVALNIPHTLHYGCCYWSNVKNNDILMATISYWLWNVYKFLIVTPSIWCQTKDCKRGRTLHPDTDIFGITSSLFHLFLSVFQTLMTEKLHAIFRAKWNNLLFCAVYTYNTHTQSRKKTLKLKQRCNQTNNGITPR